MFAFHAVSDRERCHSAGLLNANLAKQGLARSFDLCADALRLSETAKSGYNAGFGTAMTTICDRGSIAENAEETRKTDQFRGFSVFLKAVLAKIRPIP